MQTYRYQLPCSLLWIFLGTVMNFTKRIINKISNVTKRSHVEL